MPISLDWMEITIRLALTVLAGALIGFNRGEHGRPAGLRTTLLVCLAASIAMIQANLLLVTAGKSPDSFVTLDLMRLPLGILSGMGFIGGGAILKRGDVVRGVTTAATLWFVTVVGLCFGGGQLSLGMIALTLGLIVLWGLKYLELRLPQDRQATFVLTVGAQGPDERAVLAAIGEDGFRVVSFGMTYDKASGEREYQCDLLWRGRMSEISHPAFLRNLIGQPGVTRARWSPQGQATASL
jgi:putative Mg2+ transporter-C (MgtC) family protein